MRKSRVKARMERYKASSRDCSVDRGRVKVKPARIVRAENKRLATGKLLFNGPGKGIMPDKPVNQDMATAKVYWAGVLGIDNPRMCGKLNAIA